jgi:hypothetical protein
MHLGLDVETRHDSELGDGSLKRLEKGHPSAELVRPGVMSDLTRRPDVE